MMVGMRHADNRTWAAETIAVIPMIETAQAIANLDEILSVPGIDAIYVGPADLGVTFGFEPSGNDGNPVFDDALATIVEACRRHGIVPGIHATGPLTPLRRGRGSGWSRSPATGWPCRAGFASELAAAANRRPAGADTLYYEPVRPPPPPPIWARTFQFGFWARTFSKSRTSAPGSGVGSVLVAAVRRLQLRAVGRRRRTRRAPWSRSPPPGVVRRRTWRSASSSVMGWWRPSPTPWPARTRSS